MRHRCPRVLLGALLLCTSCAPMRDTTKRKVFVGSMAVGIALPVAGGYLLALDGQQTGCLDSYPPGSQCPYLWDTEDAGLTLMAVAPLIVLAAGLAMHYWPEPPRRRGRR